MKEPLLVYAEYFLLDMGRGGEGRHARRLHDAKWFMGWAGKEQTMMVVGVVVGGKGSDGN